MPVLFDSGYCQEPFRTLVRDVPDASVFPTKDFRTEWGPVFHRGRLDGSARLLIVGQDPAQHDVIARRTLELHYGTASVVDTLRPGACDSVVVQGTAKRLCVPVLPLVAALGKPFPYLVAVVR